MTSAADVEKIEKINIKLELLKAEDRLTATDALSRANEIVKMINEVLVVGNENSYELYEKARDAYILASEKVTIDKRDAVAFPSNFWSMRAKEEKIRHR